MTVEAGVTVEQIQDILVAVAPIVGTARTMSAAAKLTEALGIVIIALAAELEAEEQAGSPGRAETRRVEPHCGRPPGLRFSRSRR